MSEFRSDQEVHPLEMESSDIQASSPTAVDDIVREKAAQLAALTEKYGPGRLVEERGETWYITATNAYTLSYNALGYNARDLPSWPGISANTIMVG